MKKIFTLLSFCLIINTISSQEATNFTVTTTHGESFDLYELLDDGKTVVMDIFFVNCPPCNAIAPHLQALNLEWGDGNNDVVFLSLTDVDTNAEISAYEELHELTFPASGRDAGAIVAVAPYKNGVFGQFLGYPTISVIAPDRSVNFDLWIDAGASTIALIDAAIEQTGAEKPTTSVYEAEGVKEIKAFPNPVINNLQVTFELQQSSDVSIKIMDTMGRMISTSNQGFLSAGEQSISIDFENAPSGTYLVEMTGNGQALASFNVVK